MNRLRRWRQTTIANQMLAGSSVLLTLSTAGLVIVGTFQYFTSRNHLSAMQNMIGQNERLIRASSDQAGASAKSANVMDAEKQAVLDSADAAKKSASAAKTLTEQNKELVAAARTQANASMSQADTSKRLVDQNEKAVSIAVVPFKHRLGMCRDNGSIRSEVSMVDELVDGADLIYDASAEIGINHLMSEIAQERDIPYVCVSTTFGAWGGRLIRVRPGGKTAGCWMCHSWAVEHRAIPVPSSDPKGEVQPAGCADPTFTGSGFDVAQIALAGVRLAIGTLNTSSADYPDVDWDVAIINFRDADGRGTVPRWDVFPLEIQSDCENHKAHGRQSMDSRRSFKSAQ